MQRSQSHFQTVGQKYGHYQITKIVDITELHCRMIELTHLPTGTQVIHIENDDPENLFCLSFKTIPTTSNGVAHILEHTVLCGSEHFPVKDPFFAMQRRSLNTFMNALTGADFTCYPAATQVPKDFYNLLSVYIDAVFHPILDRRSFMQEGHRLEFASPLDANTPLEYKGIVFNEMKGALSSPTMRLNEEVNAALYPDLTYGINSGGDPKDIPSLTYEQLIDFHHEFYHPSRCLFFFYGNIPLEGHLDFIEEQILKDVKAASPIPPIPLQKRFTSPKRIVKSYPIADDDEKEDQTLISFGWLTCHILEQQELLSLNILELVLMDTDASPLKLALLKSGMCKQAQCYMDSEISEVPIILTLKGCSEGDADKLEAVIRNALTHIVEEGVSLTAIENAIHQLEIQKSEITGDHAPFGLSLFMRSALLKQHGGRPEDGLVIHSLFDAIRQKNLQDPHYFGNLIRKHFLDNPHFVRVVFVPDNALGAKEAAEEKTLLSEIKTQLTPNGQQALIDRAHDLATFQKRQEEHEDDDVLPTLTLDDVPRLPRDYPLNRETAGNLTIFSHHCFTNEIVYADLVFDLPNLSEEDLPVARFLTTIIAQMGCGKRSYTENLEYIQANTGGVGSTLTFNLQAADSTKFAPSLYIRGKALHSKADKLFTLLGEMATDVDFNDLSRLKELVSKQHVALHSGLNQNALRYAINLSSSGLDIPSKVANHWYGLKYYREVEKWATEFDLIAESLRDKLNRLKHTMLGVGEPQMVITCEAEMYDKIRKNKFYGLDQLETRSYDPWVGNYDLKPVESQGRIISSPVAFIGKVMKTVSYTHPDAPALNIAAFLLENLYLHASLREQGGAYGGGASSSPMSANFYFYSYRDPNIVSTLSSFQQAVHALTHEQIDPQDIEEAKLEMIQALDTPVSPGSRGDVAYGWIREGKPFEVRCAFRDRVLNLTAEDVIAAVNRHVIPQLASASVAVFAGKELLEKENKKFVAQGDQPLLLKKI